jgi:hypothetical protein
MRIPYRVPHIQHQGAQRHHPHHQRAPHASFVKATFRKGLLWYLPCTSPHRSSSGSEESGLHHDIMEWAEQLAPVRQSHRRVSDTKGYLMTSPGGIAFWEIGSSTHVVNQELRGFLASLEPVLAASSIHIQTRNNDEGLNVFPRTHC